MLKNTMAGAGRIDDELHRKLIEAIEPYARDHKIYQSWDLLGIDGQRPVEARFKIYGLDDLIGPETSILDLGSNVGFMTCRCGQAGRAAWGLERYDHWVRIARLAAAALGLDNVFFENCDALAFEAPYEFDLILSLSFHHWGPEVFAKYVEEVFKRNLKVGGRLLFESHRLNPDGGPQKDPFHNYVDYMIRHGFSAETGGTCQCPTNYPRPNPYREWVILELLEK